MLRLSCSVHDIVPDQPFVRQTKSAGDLTQRLEVRERQQGEEEQWWGNTSKKDFLTFSDRNGNVPESCGSRTHSHLYRSVRHKSPLWRRPGTRSCQGDNVRLESAADRYTTSPFSAEALDQIVVELQVEWICCASSRLVQADSC